MFDKDAIDLTFIHPWMTLSDARLLFEDEYMRFKDYKKYHGIKTVSTLMNMSYGHWQRESEALVRARLDLIKSRLSDS